MHIDDVSPRTQVADLGSLLADTFGPVQAWTATITTHTGAAYVLYPPGQSPAQTHQMHLDAAHILACGGCGDCRPLAG